MAYERTIDLCPRLKIAVDDWSTHCYNKHMNTELTPLQKTQAAYAHFTLEEWQVLASLVKIAMKDNGDPHDNGKNLLAKFPSAVL